VSKPPEKILLVDDEPRVLSGLHRRLCGRFALEMATGPAEALETLETTPDIAVIVVDMRMPGMSGVELLARVRAKWPQIRGIMLTGNTDQQTAVAAVNEGEVFRFFNKPVDAEILAEALEAAIEEYRFTADSQAQIQRLRIQAASGEQTRKSFLAMMNHELRTPLNHILGFSALLEQRCRQRGEHESLEYISYIRESGQALLRVLNRIMEVVRLTAGDIETHDTIFDLGRVLQDEVAHYRTIAAARNVTISFAIPRAPLPVRAGEEELAQAFAELLDNAVKFNRPGGHIAIAVTGSDEDLTIRIADTGIGISEADIGRMRTAFSQEEDGLNRRFEGVGIGLTLAALTIQAYGGALSLDSRKNQGTVAIIRLKRAAAEEQQAARIA
jgi:signal transduction histidine kinase